jgi:hypothetical protein
MGIVARWGGECGFVQLSRVSDYEMDLPRNKDKCRPFGFCQNEKIQGIGSSLGYFV